MRLLIFMLIALYCSPVFSLECKKTEFPFNKEAIQNKKNFLVLERQQSFEYLLFELTNKKPNVELAKNLYFVMLNRETNHDVKMFLEILESASNIKGKEMTPLKFEEICELFRKTIGKT